MVAIETIVFTYGMELRQLAYFDAVIRAGGFTSAARQLHVAQPAISAQIKALETELGVALIDRATRPPALTHAGELFQARVRQILDHVDAARREMNEMSAVVRGTVRIGVTQVLGPVDLVTVMATFRRAYPGVALTSRSGLLEPLVAELDAGALDVVVGPEHAGLRAGHDVHHLADERLVLAVPPHHPLAAPGRVGLGAARDELFVCLPPGSGMHALLCAAASAAGFDPQIDFFTDSPSTIREFVAAGLGVAVMAASTTVGPGPTVVTRDLIGAPEHPPIAVITPKSPVPPATRAFAAHLVASLAPDSRPATRTAENSGAGK